MTTYYPNASATGLVFTKSSRSTDQANCVECAGLPGAVAVCDSKNPGGPALVYDTAAFRRFAAAVGDDALVPVN
ncbi:DUF397 domain-containing protein [Kitasatospora aureofaciens]|uniref:DUF397 domain-containing protein n=1 Tax=Kitasatospora aureofaciens TaxID=1894 RepID=UPI001C485125|nr:DUF397 domain-containing protein [Kitasatospora aureofaciens]MBV6701385.1 DUF397 domain-containing protein [Kitasatospora aureofaciens]